MFQVFQRFHLNVARVSFDVVKVDRDVAYIAIVVHVCCNCLSLKFHLFFVQALCKCFKRTSQVFHLSFFFAYCMCCV